MGILNTENAKKRLEIGFWDNLHEIIIEEIELSHKKELDNMQEGKHPDQEKS